MRVSKIIFLSACSILLITAALAQSAGERPKVAPGLWQTRMTTRTAGMNSNMPPRTTEYRSCVTEQTIAESFVSLQQQRANCSKANPQMSATQVTFDMSCEQSGGASMKIHIDVVFDSDSSAHVVVHSEGEMAGHRFGSDGSGTSRRIAADCGSVQPGSAQMVH